MFVLTLMVFGLTAMMTVAVDRGPVAQASRLQRLSTWQAGRLPYALRL